MADMASAVAAPRSALGAPVPSRSCRGASASAAPARRGVQRLRGGLLRLTALGAVAVLAATCGFRAAYVPDPAVLHYTKALRGAAVESSHGSVSRGFQHLARLHYWAVRLRRNRDYGRASAVYQRAIAMQRAGELPQADEVHAAVAAAHSSLNLALTEQARESFDSARHAFQNGARLVQELMRTEHHAWVDGQHQVRLEMPGSAGGCCDAALTQALKWLATLLTAWSLLERKRGRVGPASRLAHRAAFLDDAKAPVLRWKVAGTAESQEVV